MKVTDQKIRSIAAEDEGSGCQEVASRIKMGMRSGAEGAEGRVKGGCEQAGRQYVLLSGDPEVAVREQVRRERSK